MQHPGSSPGLLSARGIFSPDTLAMPTMSSKAQRSPLQAFIYCMAGLMATVVKFLILWEARRRNMSLTHLVGKLGTDFSLILNTNVADFSAPSGAWPT